MVFEQAPTNKISVNAAEQDDHIESVTVFQNRAEVKRRVNIELMQGRNRVDVEWLPTCIDENSIRVEGIANAVIFDVVHHRQPNDKTPAPRDSSLVQNADECRRALETLRKEREVALQQSNYLESYGNALSSKPMIDVERTWTQKLAKPKKAHNKAQAKIRPDELDPKRRTKISVTVLADADGKADFLLKYFVSNASWTPLYDVRVSIAKAPGLSSQVAIHYRASVVQSTGENWPNAALTLSTASPQLGEDIPNLKAWRIGYAPPRSPWSRSTTQTSTAESDMQSPTPTHAHLTRDETTLWSLSRAGTTRRTARVESVGIPSTSFDISGRTSIPSDYRNHKVVISTLNLIAEPEWISIPREQQSVFLQCKVVNSSEITLLPGEASVYMDDNFVSKSSIENVSPNNWLKVLLGVDDALRVSYPPAHTQNCTVNRMGLFKGNNDTHSVVAHSQRMTIRNTRATTITSLRVFDYVPISINADLKVSLLYPSSLGPIVQMGALENGGIDGSRSEREWTNVKAGVKARWAAPDLGGESVVEWECKLKPSEEVELDLAWEVSAPVGRKWENK